MASMAPAPASGPAPITVSALVAALKQQVESVPAWQRLAVTGELSGVRRHTSGHWYFVLKDANAALPAVMFQRDAQSLAFPLRDGQAVTVTGQLGVFPARGSVQLYARTVTPIGEGAQKLALAALEARLEREGVFTRPKRPLPTLPRRIGVITSPTGAVRRDIEMTRDRRYPGLPLVLFPAIVQGPEAPASLVAALHQAAQAAVDVVIVGRGGGSAEDLSAFNAEAVVRAVAACPVPCISAVGHGTDHSLTDRAADYSVPTPTAAAELAVPVHADLVADLAALQARLETAWRLRREREQAWMTAWLQRPVLLDPQRLLQPHQQAFDLLTERLQHAWERRVATWRQDVDRLTHRVAAVNPLAILERGYAMVTPATGDRPVTARAVAPGDVLTIHWADGTATVRVDTLTDRTLSGGASS